MITNSNPFLRNDYYPDQNDIDDLNTRINEVQSDVDLLAISVNEKTEAVNGRLNNLQNDYNESFATESLNANTANINVLNINVQAVIKDLNAVNTYTENLIVNKPVLDLSLRTPHLENTTSLNGNFYAPNIIGGKIDNIQFENIQNFKAVNIEADKVKANVADLNVLNAINIEANEVKANKLIGDFSAEPTASSAVVGYDENGQLIPIRASYAVSFPEYSDYLKTDAQGTARKGTSESGVVQSTNLIQAGAVQNMYDAVNANFNNVSNSFNAVNANFNNVSNSFNAVNVNVSDNFNTVNNSFNAVNESFNAVNNTFGDYYNKTEAANKFVAQVEGKGLSTEDFTTAEKNKLNGIAEGANKTEITSTVTSDTDKVPSCAAVSAALEGKLDINSRASGINDTNKNDDESVPSVKAVATYFDSNIPGAMDFTVISQNNTISVTNNTNGLCAVRITKMSDGSTQYKSNINALGKIANKQTAFTFNIETAAHYMIEAWYYNISTQKLIPTAVKYA